MTKAIKPVAPKAAAKPKATKPVAVVGPSVLSVADTTALIGKIKTAGTKLDGMIHQAAVSALSNHTKHGDTSLVNLLMLAMPKSGRANALAGWFLRFGALALNDNKDSRKEAPLVHDKARVKSIPDLVEAHANPFWLGKAQEGTPVWAFDTFMAQFERNMNRLVQHATPEQLKAVQEKVAAAHLMRREADKLESDPLEVKA